MTTSATARPLKSGDRVRLPLSAGGYVHTAPPPAEPTFEPGLSAATYVDGVPRDFHLLPGARGTVAYGPYSTVFGPCCRVVFDGIPGFVGMEVDWLERIDE